MVQLIARASVSVWKINREKQTNDDLAIMAGTNTKTYYARVLHFGRWTYFVWAVERFYMEVDHHGFKEYGKIKKGTIRSMCIMRKQLKLSAGYW